MNNTSMRLIKRCICFIFLLCLNFSLETQAQKFVVKSNMLYDLTTTFNVGGEVKCGEKQTFSLSLNYNPWTFGDNRKMKHILIQPEYRRWLDDVFAGGFVGFQVHYGQFNWGGMLPLGMKNGKMFGIENSVIKNHRFQGNLIGCGLSCGYQWMLGPLWNLEASIALGYARLSYHTYGPAKGDVQVGGFSHTNYWGPTQAGLSLVYIIQ